MFLKWAKWAISKPNRPCQLAVSANFKRSVQDVRASRGADVASAHNLVVPKTMLKLNRTGKSDNIVRRYEISKLAMPGIRKQFQLQLRNRFSCLTVEEEDDKLDRTQKHTTGSC